VDHYGFHSARRSSARVMATRRTESEPSRHGPSTCRSAAAQTGDETPTGLFIAFGRRIGDLLRDQVLGGPLQADGSIRKHQTNSA